MAQEDPTIEPIEALESPHWPLEVWAARCCIYLLAQGGILLLAYAYYGWKTDPHSFALGFRLDPIQAAMRFVLGLIGTVIGFYRPRYATPFVITGTIIFVAFAALGTLDPHALGMMLDARTTLFNWCVALLGAVAGAYALGRGNPKG